MAVVRRDSPEVGSLSIVEGDERSESSWGQRLDEEEKRQLQIEAMRDYLEMIDAVVISLMRGFSGRSFGAHSDPVPETRPPPFQSNISSFGGALIPSRNALPSTLTPSPPFRNVHRLSRLAQIPPTSFPRDPQLPTRLQIQATQVGDESQRPDSSAYFTDYPDVRDAIRERKLHFSHRFSHLVTRRPQESRTRKENAGPYVFCSVHPSTYLSESRVPNSPPTFLYPRSLPLGRSRTARRKSRSPINTTEPELNNAQLGRESATMGASPQMHMAMMNPPSASMSGSSSRSPGLLGPQPLPTPAVGSPTSRNLKASSSSNNANTNTNTNTLAPPTTTKRRSTSSPNAATSNTRSLANNTPSPRQQTTFVPAPSQPYPQPQQPQQAPNSKLFSQPSLTSKRSPPKGPPAPIPTRERRVSDTSSNTASDSDQPPALRVGVIEPQQSMMGQRHSSTRGGYGYGNGNGSGYATSYPYVSAVPSNPKKGRAYESDRDKKYYSSSSGTDRDRDRYAYERKEKERRSPYVPSVPMAAPPPPVSHYVSTNGYSSKSRRAPPAPPPTSYAAPPPPPFARPGATQQSRNVRFRNTLQFSATPPSSIPPSPVHHAAPAYPPSRGYPAAVPLTGNSPRRSPTVPLHPMTQTQAHTASPNRKPLHPLTSASAPTRSAPTKRQGWFNAYGDQLWTNEGGYVAPQPGHENPPDLAKYPKRGEGWMNEHGRVIDMQHRAVKEKTLKSALKRRT